jgi:hypothetical protein
VLARTTVDNTGSRRTAAAAGLVRRPNLEREDEGFHAVTLVNHWPHDTHGRLTRHDRDR